MSQFIHIADELLPPLYWIDERLYHLRPGKSLYAAPADPMVLLFLDADHEITFADNRRVRVRAGDICVFPALLPRVYQGARKQLASRFHALRLLFKFPPKTVSPHRKPMAGKPSDPLVFLKEFLGGFRHLPGAVTPRVHERITEFRREIETRAPGHQVRISALWLDFTVECARSCERPATGENAASPASRADLLIQRIKAFIVENHAAALTLDEIAWQAKLSREHVARTFRQATGHTVFDYLQLVRIEVAQQLLSDSALPITEVARRTGFSSATLFGRVFKRQLGLSPIAYRQSVLASMKFTPSIIV